jgi:hypothetical protein
MPKDQRSEKPTPAGCLKGDGLHSGDENVEPFAAPEEKAAETRGQPLTGKITLDQYLTLVEHGYSGDVVRRWTAYHADQEIRQKTLRVRTSPSPQPHSRYDLMVQQRAERRKAERLDRERQMPTCPVCGVKIANPARVLKHVAKVHPQQRHG